MNTGETFFNLIFIFGEIMPRDTKKGINVKNLILIILSDILPAICWAFESSAVAVRLYILNGLKILIISFNSSRFISFRVLDQLNAKALKKTNFSKWKRITPTSLWRRDSGEWLKVI